MNTYEIIKELASIRKISIAQLERILDLSNGSLSKWSNSRPNSEPLSKVADYFQVSTDYLLGRTENPHISTTNHNDFSNTLTEEYHIINRSAKVMTPDEQKTLVDLIHTVFKDLDERKLTMDDNDDF